MDSGSDKFFTSDQNSMAEAKTTSDITTNISTESIDSFPSERARLVCAAIVFTVSLALYSLTLAPTVTLVDSGELIAASSELGVAHPPGFPLYTALAHLATLVPAGNIAQRVNFASALFAALASAMMTMTVFEALLCASLLPRRRRKEEKKKRQKKTGKKESKYIDLFEGVPSAVLIAPPLMAGLLAAFSRTLWGYATIAEVYTLNTLMILAVFFFLLRWRRKRIESISRGVFDVAQSDRLRAPRKHENSGDSQANSLRHVSGEDRGNEDRLLMIAAFLFGLALGVHHVTVALMLPALATVVYSTEGLAFFKSKKLLRSSLFALAGLSIYLYLPLSASRERAMNWGDPDTMEKMWWHVTGRQYQEFISFSLETMAGQFKEFLLFAGREFGPFWLPVALMLAVAGLVSLFRSDRSVFWFLALVILADLGYALNYDIAEDKDAYYLPAFFALMFAAAFGALWFVRFVRASFTKAAAVMLVLVPAIALAFNYSFDDRSRYHIAEDYVSNILSAVDEGGMVLTLDWQVYSPMFYFLEVERRRPDVVAIDVNQLRRSWYFDYLKRAYPEMIERSREEVEAYLADLRLWEHDPDGFNSDREMLERINRNYNDMVLSIVARHLDRAPVYATLDLIASRAHRDAEITRALTTSYQPVPQGLVFQLMKDKTFHQPVDVRLSLRGLADGSLKFEEDDVVIKKVLPVYAGMLTNRGVYFAAYNRHEEAIESFRQALALDPRNESARRALSESENKRRVKSN
jgi:tetratricopeptide (TPR) repeat protein